MCEASYYTNIGMCNEMNEFLLGFIDVPASGMYFMTYECLKKALTPANSTSLSPLSTVFAGGGAGSMDLAVAIPADVRKGRWQTCT